MNKISDKDWELYKLAPFLDFNIGCEKLGIVLIIKNAGTHGKKFCEDIISVCNLYMEN